ncbi:hypothetical protein ACFORH_24105 [Amycolatopsis roodepoortensis]|uniref:Uncharacterized protein n=1 Tax=Amycolatopsis roodepoortensis TaxID=700274 RepID=A0ABR9LKY4_9PSEU|nr:hypothetical protein [Amycolatopsis roodepoortensis]MBE1581272.1 hypothetical protein [Amycolatopsis roodepoortensis]
MKDALLRVPRWALVLVACLSAGALFVITAVSKSLSGTALVLLLVAGIVFAATAIVIPQIQQWQTSQAARLKVSLSLLVPDVGITRFIDSDEVIESLVRKEKLKLLDAARKVIDGESFKRARPTKVRKLSDYDTKSGGPTVAEIQRIQDKRAAGEDLTVDEVGKLAEVDEVLSSFREALSSMAWPAKVVAENRTISDFAAEVEEYGSKFDEYVNEHLVWAFVSSSEGSVHFTLSNETDKVFENVAVTLKIRGVDTVAVESEFRQPTATPPQSPRSYGPRRESNLPVLRDPGDYSWLVGAGERRQITIPASGVLIENGETCEVEFTNVTLRPRGAVDLETLVFFVNDPVLSEIDIQWTATATNVDGQVTGGLQVELSGRSLPVRGYLDVLMGDEKG